MMPNTSVRPAAMRNSITPYCRPLRACSRTITGRSLPLHGTFLVVRVLVVLEDGLLDLHLDVGAGLDGFEKIEVLDGEVVDVVGIGAAGRLVVGLAHGGDHALLVAEIALDGAHGRIDQHDAVV